MFLGERAKATSHSCRASLEPEFQHLPVARAQGWALRDDPRDREAS